MSTMLARFGTKAPILFRDTMYRVNPVHMKWKDAKDVCINFKAGSLKMALFVKTMPIVAAMLIAVQRRNFIRIAAFGAGG